MMQTIDGKRVYVVEFDTMPELPITGLTEDEAVWERFQTRLNRILDPLRTSTRKRTRGAYAEALQAAIEGGVITEPGKYAIHIDTQTRRWNVFRVNE